MEYGPGAEERRGTIISVSVSVCERLNGDSRRLKNDAMVGELSASGCSYCVGTDSVMASALRDPMLIIVKSKDRYDVGNWHV